MWLITMGSGGISSGCSLDGISANFIRLHSKIYKKWKLWLLNITACGLCPGAHLSNQPLVDYL